MYEAASVSRETTGWCCEAIAWGHGGSARSMTKALDIRCNVSHIAYSNTGVRPMAVNVFGIRCEFNAKGEVINLRMRKVATFEDYAAAMRASADANAKYGFDTDKGHLSYTFHWDTHNVFTDTIYCDHKNHTYTFANAPIYQRKDWARIQIAEMQQYISDGKCGSADDYYETKHRMRELSAAMEGKTAREYDPVGTWHGMQSN